jgi:hypothetical protein
VFVTLLGDRNVLVVPALPVALFVAAQQEDPALGAAEPEKRGGGSSQDSGTDQLGNCA